MEQAYVLQELLGEGTFGSVWKAVDDETGEIVAVKQLKKPSRTHLLEVMALSDLSGHPNIVQLISFTTQDNGLHKYVFEYMEGDLRQRIRKQLQPLSHDQIKSWMFQILQAVAYTHRKGYIHRDLKPANILVAGSTLKLADFGMAKKMCSYCDCLQTWTHVPWAQEHCACGGFTDYVCTRWYRAPELLLQSPTYSSAMDMWSVGVIMAELYRCQALFRGRTSAHQLHEISSLLGAPTLLSWPQGVQLAAQRNFQFPNTHSSSKHSWAHYIPNARPQALHLIQSLCTWNPHKRLTASQALQHPFFRSDCTYIAYARPKEAKLSQPFICGGPCVCTCLTLQLSHHPCKQVMI